MVFVDVSLLSFEQAVAFEGVCTDSEIENRLGTKPALEFRYCAECTLKDSGIQILLSVKGAIYSRCDLCGEEVISPCECVFDEELTEDDSAFDSERAGYILDELIGDCVVMSVPRMIRCKDDCKGLCSVCGANLNKGKCLCNEMRSKDNNPFSKLLDKISTGGAKNGSTKK